MQNEIEKAIEMLIKYHDSVLLKIHSDFLQNPKKYQDNGVPNNFICEIESVRLAIDTAICSLEKRQSGELVEVVRCKNCKGYMPAICTCKTKQITMGENAYCSYGEQKPK